MKSAIIYQGPSLLDGKPIVAIAIWSTRNTKTGGMVQTYIIRSDISPLNASKSGADFSICGDCPMRGTPTNDPTRKQAIKRGCYVNLGQGPTVVFKSFIKGIYKAGSATNMGRNRMVRIGTYGDPAAIPTKVWNSLVSESTGWTGYTHQWRTMPELKRLVMASADNARDMIDAHKQGWRTFRVMDSMDEKTNKESHCPASKESGAQVQCSACLLCMGNTSKAKRSISILQH